MRAVFHFMNENTLDEESIRIDFIAITPTLSGHRVYHIRGVEMGDFLEAL